MMNALWKLFLKGLVVTIPVALTVAIVWWMASVAERMLGGLLTRILPEGWYIPGLGLLSALALILLVGLLSHVLIFQKLFELGEALLNRLPLVKSIYSALKDFISYLSPAGRNQFGRVVLVQLPGHEFQLLGFVTRERFDDLPLEPAADEPVAVYLPMSYQIGGFTLFLPASALTPVDLPFETAMRLALTGGVARNETDPATGTATSGSSPGP